MVPPAWPPRARSVFLPGGSPVADESVPPLCGGFRITADATVAAGGARGRALPRSATGTAGGRCTPSTAGSTFAFTRGRRAAARRVGRARTAGPPPAGGHAAPAHALRAVVRRRRDSAGSTSTGGLPFALQHGGTGLCLGYDRGFPVVGRLHAAGAVERHAARGRDRVGHAGAGGRRARRPPRRLISRQPGDSRRRARRRRPPRGARRRRRRVARPRAAPRGCAGRAGAAASTAACGAAEKSKSLPNWRRRPRRGWSYSVTRPSRSLSPSWRNVVAVEALDRDLVGDAGGVERRGATPARCRVAKTGLERGLDASRGHRLRAERAGAGGRAQRLPVALGHRRHADPALVLRAVEAVAGPEAVLAAVEVRPVPGRAVGAEPDVGGEEDAPVVQRGPQLLALAGALRGARGRAACRPPTAWRWTRRTCRSAGTAAGCR